MNTLLRTARLGLFLIPLLFLLPASASAFEVRLPEEAPASTSGDVLLAEDELIADDLFIVGESVSIEGTVAGDLYVFAGEASITGTVTGDVYVAAGNVVVDGVVSDDLMVAAGELRVAGQVGDNAVVGAGQSLFEEGSMIGRDLVIGSGLLNFDGALGRFLTFGAGDLTVDGEVGDAVRGSADTLTLGTSAVVGGDVDFSGPQEPVYQDGSSVVGEKRYTEAGKAPAVAERSEASAVLIGFGKWLLKLLGMILAGAIMLILAPMSSKAAEEALQRETGKTFLVGLVALFTFPLVALVLMITVVGMRAAFAWGAFLTFFMIMGHTFVGLWLGRLLLKGRTQGKPVHDLWVMSLGILLVSIFVSIPFLGAFFSILVAVFGVGAALIATRRRNLSEMVEAPVSGSSAERHFSRDDSPAGDEE